MRYSACGGRSRTRLEPAKGNRGSVGDAVGAHRWRHDDSAPRAETKSPAYTVPDGSLLRRAGTPAIPARGAETDRDHSPARAILGPLVGVAVQKAHRRVWRRTACGMPGPALP